MAFYVRFGLNLTSNALLRSASIVMLELLVPLERGYIAQRQGIK